MADLEADVEALWSGREHLDLGDAGAAATLRAAIDLLDTGRARVSEIVEDVVVVHQWLKHAIMLYLASAPMEASQVGPFEMANRVPLKVGFSAAPRHSGVRLLFDQNLSRHLLATRHQVVLTEA